MSRLLSAAFGLRAAVGFGVWWLAASAADAAAPCAVMTTSCISRVIAGDDIETALAAHLKTVLSKPRYFEATCVSFAGATKLYPGIPSKECTYTSQGLPGWVVLADLPADMLAKWIVSGCGSAPDKRRCVALTAAYAWSSNQLSYPIVGNMIEPGTSGGGSSKVPENFVFLHGVTIKLPAGMSEHGAIPTAQQRQLLLPLLETTPADGAVAQVSRPAGLRREIYTRYAQPIVVDGRALDAGASCPMLSRRADWLRVSRLALLQGWTSGSHPLFAATSAALLKNEAPGAATCRR